jgi:hypothetical protein
MTRPVIYAAPVLAFVLGVATIASPTNAAPDPGDMQIARAEIVAAASSRW